MITKCNINLIMTLSFFHSFIYTVLHVVYLGNQVTKNFFMLLCLLNTGTHLNEPCLTLTEANIDGDYSIWHFCVLLSPLVQCILVKHQLNRIYVCIIEFLKRPKINIR